MRFSVAANSGSPVEAAAHFHAHVLPDVLQVLSRAEHLLLVFPSADHTHRAWRLAVVQGLAREHAPARVNAVASDDAVAIAEAEAFLSRSPGVAGQYLALDGQGAGDAAP